MRIKKYLTDRRHAHGPKWNGWNENYIVDIIKRRSYGDPSVISSAGSKTLMTTRSTASSKQQAYRVLTFRFRRNFFSFASAPVNTFETFPAFFSIRLYPGNGYFACNFFFLFQQTSQMLCACCFLSCAIRIKYVAVTKIKVL